jgi:hypothetical protein
MKQRHKIQCCKTCGDPITAPRKKFYCSAGCRNQAAKKPSAPTEGRDENGKAPARPCVQCTRSFQPHWQRPDAKLCSRKCQALWINGQGLGPRHDDDELLARLIKVINTHERSLSQDELMADAGTTHKVLSKRKWSMEFLYQAAGRTYGPPYLASRLQDRVYSVLCELLPLYIEIECDKPLPGMHGFKEGKLRADMFVKDLGLIVEADGKQHQTGRDDPDQLAYIRANDRLKDEYAAANGLTLIRITETVDTRLIKARLLRGIRRTRPGFRPLHPSNAKAGPSSTRRMPKRLSSSDRPRRKLGEKGEPLHDVYCRGCHERPSYKNTSTYLCSSCWDAWNRVRYGVPILNSSEAAAIKEEIIGFIKGRGRYVWQPEVSMHVKSITGEELKAHGIKVDRICRELGLFPPADDGRTGVFIQRVRGFVERYVQEHGKTPTVRETLDGAPIDHDTLWKCMDYAAYIEELGGKLNTNVRHRYPTPEEFLQAAIRVVQEAGHWLPITAILKKLGISHPAYLANFKHVRNKEIHQKAGVPMPSKGQKPE